MNWIGLELIIILLTSEINQKLNKITFWTCLKKSKTILLLTNNFFEIKHPMKNISESVRREVQRRWNNRNELNNGVTEFEFKSVIGCLDFTSVSLYLEIFCIISLVLSEAIDKIYNTFTRNSCLDFLFLLSM